MPTKILDVVQSWLRDRKGRVVVTGAETAQMELRDQVFQGTVWGPMLWNTYYADAKEAVQKTQLREIIFADDLTALREYPKEVGNDIILKNIRMSRRVAYLGPSEPG